MIRDDNHRPARTQRARALHFQFHHADPLQHGDQTDLRRSAAGLTAAGFYITKNNVADFTPVGVTMATDIDKYFSFVLTMFIVFGIAFEVPVVEVLLVKIGAVTVQQLKDIRRYVVVGIFVVAASIR